MITAQQEHKSRWRGRYWRRVELELVEGGAVILDGGSPKALVRLSDESSDVARIEIADVAAYEAARRACVLPKTETLRLRGAGLFEALDAHDVRALIAYSHQRLWAAAVEDYCSAVNELEPYSSPVAAAPAAFVLLLRGDHGIYSSVY